MRPFVRRLPALVTVGFCVLSGVASAQPAPPPATPMTPSAPHEAMGLFIGSWTIAEMPAEMQFRETCDWPGSGRRHVVCRSTWQAQTGPREGLSIFSYQASDSTYAYHGFRPGGSFQHLTGRTADGSWDFWGDEGEGASRARTRVQITTDEGGGFTFTEQTATGDAEWGEAEVVHYVRTPTEGP
jgi:hypothetical protein